MKLAAPITVTLQNGQTMTSDTFDMVIIDFATKSTALAQLHPGTRALVLWTGSAYVAAGDYTQAQAEARLLEILGDDPVAVLNPPPRASSSSASA